MKLNLSIPLDKTEPITLSIDDTEITVHTLRQMLRDIERQITDAMILRNAPERLSLTYRFNAITKHALDPETETQIETLLSHGWMYDKHRPIEARNEGTIFFHTVNLVKEYNT